MSEKVGTWPQVCVQRAFVDGASWWIWANGSTPFPAERDLMETEAVRRYGEPASDLIAAAEERGRVEKLTLADAKALAMEARTESLRVVLTEAAKAQQEASDVTFAMASESGRGWDPDAHLMPIAEAILGAEERGRRRGVEEHKALKAAHEYCLYMFEREWLTDERNRSIFAAHIFAILDRALAPRDSAPDLVVCDYCPEHPHPLNDDGTKCVHPRAPRDSGKGAK